MFLTFTVVYSSKKKDNHQKGDGGWKFPCQEDSIFGFVSGGDSRIEKLLGSAWGVGTTVATYYYPKAADFALNALDFGNMVVNWEERDCTTPFKKWMYDTFATKEETKSWIEMRAKATEARTWKIVTSWNTNEIKRDLKNFAATEVLWEEWLEDPKKGELSTNYLGELDDLKDNLHSCAVNYMETAGTRDHFEAYDIGALAAGARCAIDFYGILHLYYATVINYNTDSKEVDVIRKKLVTYKSDIAQWERWFNVAKQQIMKRRYTREHLVYMHHEGSCKRRVRGARSCGWGPFRGDQTTTTTDMSKSRKTWCVFRDEAFELDEKNKKPTGRIERTNQIGHGHFKECGKKDRCKDVADQGCNWHHETARDDIIERKAGVLDKKLEALRRKAFLIDFTKTTDVISQMIQGLDNYKANNEVFEVENKCALKKNHACSGRSRLGDFAIYESEGCMKKCNSYKWCNCITMSKSFGCRLETGSASPRREGENKYWALNKIDCENCALKKNHACEGKWFTDVAVFDSHKCMTECKKIFWCKCITMSASFGCRLESGSAKPKSQGGNKYSALDKTDFCSSTVESSAETAVATEQLTGEKVESAVAIENKKLKETNEALSAILRDLENQ